MIAGATHKRSASASDWMPEYIQVVGNVARTYTKLHGWSEDAWVDKLAYCEIDSPYDVDAHVSDASKPVYTKEMHEAGELPSAGMKCLITFCGDTTPRSKECVVMYAVDEVGVVNINGNNRCFDSSCRSLSRAEFKPVNTEREMAIDAANEMTLHDLATVALRGNRTPGIHDTVLLERLAKIDKADKL